MIVKVFSISRIFERERERKKKRDFLQETAAYLVPQGSLCGFVLLLLEYFATLAVWFKCEIVCKIKMCIYAVSFSTMYFVSLLLHPVCDVLYLLN